MTLAQHLPAAAIALPLATAALMLFVEERHHGLKAGLSIASAVALLATALALVLQAGTQPAQVYALGDWPAPFGIVLVSDRLSALMVLLAACLGVAALVFSVARWHRAGLHFHSLVHFLLAGLNGAFLTGDLFNLFVFFELLLAASYGLALHGSGTPRVRASLHYVVINLVASLLFLVGVSLMYGVAGTLNMADLAQRLPHVPVADRALFEIGAAVMGIAFLVKAGMWPLGFWLPSTYAAASAPAAALFAILSKVGVYAVIRVWLIVFGGQSGAELLAFGGMATLAYGILGVLSSQHLGRLAGFSVVVSSGTVLAAVGLGGPAATGAAIYYLFASTLGSAALFLLIELVERAREPGADVLAVTADAFGLAEDPQRGEEEIGEGEVGVVIPRAMAVLGLCFVAIALVVAGLPPLPGFIAKFAVLAALLDADPVPGSVWAMLALILFSSVAAIIAFGRTGVHVFWTVQERSVPTVRAIEIAPVAALLIACVALTAAAGPAMQYAAEAARALHEPDSYVGQVLRAR
jgi:multicomponent K+:H+ antiporter subunit D